MNPLSFFKGIATTVAGGWQSLLLKAAGVAIYSLLVFGGGYYTGSQNTLKPLAQATVNAAPIAAKAQHDQDKKQHGDAVVASDQAKAGHAASDAKAKPHIVYIKGKTVFLHDPADPHACDISPEMIEHYNAAGH